MADVQENDENASTQRRNSENDGSSAGTSDQENDLGRLTTTQNSRQPDMRNNEAYLTLFRETYQDSDEASNTSAHLESSQLGAVLWSASEKSKFFTALGRRGRHDLPGLARFIGTKSELEVRDYIDHIQTAERNRQLFLRHAKNVSHTRIPAAIEMGSRCEKELDRAADTLLSLQDEYDRALQQVRNPDRWLITHDVAAKMDEETDTWLDESQRTTEDTLQENSTHKDNPASLFYLRKALNLSEMLFMNTSPLFEHDHWRDLAAQNQRPEITMDTVEELHDIVVNLTRRLVQTTVFVAKSRLRQTTSGRSKPHSTIHREDVVAAFDVLNFKHDLWDYWVHLPRRLKLQIHLGLHRKGAKTSETMPYDHAEAILLVRKSKGRRQSLSSLSESSSFEEDSTDIDGATDTSAQSPPSSDSHVDMQGSPGSTTTGDDHEMSEDGSAVSAEGGNRFRDRNTTIQERQRQLEDEVDAYMEELDQQSRKQEQQRLMALLLDHPIDETKLEPPQNHRRPKRLRKDLEDVDGWTAEYEAAWETHGDMVSEEEFREVSSRSKRTKK